MNVKDRLKKLLVERGWITSDGNTFSKPRQFGFDEVSLILGGKVEFFGRCYPAKEGWEMSTRSYANIVRMLR
jgi:hypothetical protein